jgi:predicted dithiol-disulfide oxidoreductase (DUF899 family)
MLTNLAINPKIVFHTEWLHARGELLAKEKQLTRQRVEINRERRELPWVKVGETRLRWP